MGRNVLEMVKPDMIFGKLKTISLGGKNKSNIITYNCVCECGTEKAVSVYALVNGVAKTCGCGAKMIQPKIGEKHGILTVVKNTGIKNNDRRIMVIAECDCGNQVKVSYKDLKSGQTQSCGCKGRIPNPIGKRFNSLEVLSKRHDSHGTMWVVAKCDCGSEKEYQYGALAGNYTKTCGCAKSKYLDHSCFDENNEESMYWAGFIAADGCVTDENEVKIALQKSDYRHLEKFSDFCKSEHSIRLYDKENKAVTGFTSKQICKKLNLLGIVPRKSLILQPSELCLKSKDFWRGMVDGDGGVYFGNGKYKYPQIMLCGSYGSVKGFEDYVKQICATKASTVKSGSIYRFSSAGKYAVEIIKHLYGGDPVYFLDRKYETAKIIMDVYQAF